MASNLKIKNGHYIIKLFKRHTDECMGIEEFGNFIDINAKVFYKIYLIFLFLEISTFRTISFNEKV